MELVELHVGDTAACAPGHGDAVSGGDVGVGGVLVDLGGAAGAERDELRVEVLDAAGLAVEDVGPEDAVPGEAELLGGYEVNRVELLVYGDLRMGLRAADECVGDCLARRVSGVEDSPVAVAALSGQVVLVAAVLGGVLILVEGNSLGDEPVDGVLGVLGGEAHSGLVAESGAGDEGILDMGLDAVVVLQGVAHGGDSALGVGGRALALRALAQDIDMDAAVRVGKLKREG